MHFSRADRCTGDSHLDAFRRMKQAVRKAVPFPVAPPDASEGERLLAVGNFAEAERFLLSLLEQVGDRPHRRTSYAKILLALANARFQQNKFETAREAALAT